jgi:hypothetical protein
VLFEGICILYVRWQPVSRITFVPFLQRLPLLYTILILFVPQSTLAQCCSSVNAIFSWYSDFFSNAYFTVIDEIVNLHTPLHFFFFFFLFEIKGVYCIYAILYFITNKKIKIVFSLLGVYSKCYYIL